MGAPLRFKSPTRKRFDPTRISLDAITGVAFEPADTVGFEMTFPPGVVGDADPHAAQRTVSTTATLHVGNLISKTLSVSES
jgi:hypothetical protein